MRIKYCSCWIIRVRFASHGRAVIYDAGPPVGTSAVVGQAGQLFRATADPDFDFDKNSCCCTAAPNSFKQKFVGQIQIHDH